MYCKILNGWMNVKAVSRIAYCNKKGQLTKKKYAIKFMIVYLSLRHKQQKIILKENKRKKGTGHQSVKKKTGFEKKNCDYFFYLIYFQTKI